VLSFSVVGVGVGIGVYRWNTGSRDAASVPVSSTVPVPSSIAPTSSSTAPPRPPPPATILSSYGVVARSIVQENERPGTNGWQIPPTASTTISGFANLAYAHRGQVVTLYVSTDAPRFRVAAYRMGYYRGAGGRLVWQSPAVAGKVQSSCPVTTETNMVSCSDWTPSLTMTIDSAFVPGDYLLKLVGSAGEQSYVPLTVWDPSSHAAYVVKNDIYTWQAWNAYGGFDIYVGKGPCVARTYPVCNRAKVVSFDRPYAYGEGAADFLGNEYPLVRFAEKHGLDVTYATDLTIEQNPGYLLAHRALLSLGHDECWSYHERLAVLGAEAKGVNIAFFAASAILRHVRLEASPLGPARQEVDYRDSGADPLDGRGDPLDVTGNTWSAPPASWSEVSFVGAAYAGYLDPGVAADFQITDGNAWIFKNTGLQTGSILPGLLRNDFDQFQPGLHAANEQILAHSRIPPGAPQTDAGTARGDAHSDMTYYTDPVGGAGVFDSGTNDWIPALGSYEACQTCLLDPVGVITGNLLAVIGRAPAIRIQPAVPNSQLFY
jgi:hypothetical protein